MAGKCSYTGVCAGGFFCHFAFVAVTRCLCFAVGVCIATYRTSMSCVTVFCTGIGSYNAVVLVTLCLNYRIGICILTNRTGVGRVAVCCTSNLCYYAFIAVTVFFNFAVGICITTNGTDVSCKSFFCAGRFCYNTLIIMTRCCDNVCKFISAISIIIHIAVNRTGRIFCFNNLSILVKSGVIVLTVDITRYQINITKHERFVVIILY